MYFVIEMGGERRLHLQNEMPMKTIYRDYYLLAMGDEFNNHELLKMSKTFQINGNIYAWRINSVFNCAYRCGVLRVRKRERCACV